ncbi:MAG: hypothetical protein COV37_14910, partial [Bdellovibrio sp. CG11_big_fil_rev_8_21_14_0_20_39_38]
PLISCNQSGTSTRVVDGDPEPPAPSGPKDAWINWTEVEGVDRDQDGVRDDVEIWINNHGQDEYIRKALKQKWKAQVEFIKLSVTDLDAKELWKKEKENIGKANDCIFFLVNLNLKNSIFSDFVKFLNSLRPVSIAIASYSEKFAGMTGMAPGFYGYYIEGETYCEFDIPKLYVNEIKIKIKKESFPTDELEKYEMEKFEASKNWSQL